MTSTPKSSESSPQWEISFEGKVVQAVPATGKSIFRLIDLAYAVHVEMFGVLPAFVYVPKIKMGEDTTLRATVGFLEIRKVSHE